MSSEEGSANQSFASLDLDSSQEQPGGRYISVEETERDNHLLGYPPSTDDTDSVDSYESGTSEYKFDEDTTDVVSLEQLHLAQKAPKAPQPVPVPYPVETAPEQTPDDLLIAPNPLRREDLYGTHRGKYADVFSQQKLQLYLNSGLSAIPLSLRQGFSSDELNKAMNDTMKINLNTAARVCVGDGQVDKRDKMSNTDLAHLLAKNGWLTFKEGRFYPVIDDLHQRQMNEIVNGAEFLNRREAKKKFEAEQYPTAEAEIMAMHTFNMICELLKEVQNERQTKIVPYQSLAVAFERMVKRESHRRIYDMYSQFLPLESDEKWNNEWFKKYTNRSSLKKFVAMTKFSGIDALPKSEFEFRNNKADLFSKNQMDEVIDRFAGGGKKNSWGGPANGGGRRNGGPPQQYGIKKKNDVVPDPDFQSATLTGGRDIPTSYRSMRPTSPDTRRRSKSPAQERSRSFGRQSPVGDRPRSRERQSNEQDNYRGRRSTSRERQQSLPRNRYQTVDAFGGARSGGRGGLGTGGDGFEGKSSNRRVESAGSSSESELTSDGEYSDESDGAKARNEEARERKRKNKEEKRKNRKPKQVAPIDYSKNRFSKSVFPGLQSDSPTPDRRNRSSSDRTLSPGPAPVRSQNEKPERTRRPGSPEAPAPVPEPAPYEIPLLQSYSNRDDERARQPSGIPFRPVPDQIKENKRKEEEDYKMRKAMDESMSKSMNQYCETGRKTTIAENMTHPGLAPRNQRSQQQQERREQAQPEFREPVQPMGSFGNTQNAPSHQQQGYQNQGSNDQYLPRQQSQQHSQRQSPQPSNGRQFDDGRGPPVNQWESNQEPFSPRNMSSSQSGQREFQPPPPDRRGFEEQRRRNDYDQHQFGGDPYRQQQYQGQQNQQQRYPQDNYQPQFPPNSGYNQQNYQEPPWRMDHGYNQQQHHQQPYLRDLPPYSQDQQFNAYRQPPPPNDQYSQGYSQQYPPQQSSYQQSYRPPMNNDRYNNGPMSRSYKNHGPPQDQYHPQPFYQPMSSNGNYSNMQGSNNGYHPSQTPQPYQDEYRSGNNQSSMIVAMPTAPRPLSYASRHDRFGEVMRQAQTGDPNGWALLESTIKFKVLSFLKDRKEAGSAVFETDLHNFVNNIVQNADFNIVQFIKKSMRVEVTIVYNDRREELQFVSNV